MIEWWHDGTAKPRKRATRSLLKCTEVRLQDQNRKSCRLVVCFFRSSEIWANPDTSPLRLAAYTRVSSLQRAREREGERKRARACGSPRAKVELRLVAGAGSCLPPLSLSLSGLGNTRLALNRSAELFQRERGTCALIVGRERKAAQEAAEGNQGGEFHYA